MATINFILVGFFVSFAFTTWSPVSGKLLVTPEDVVAVLGGTVQLNCSTDDTYGVNWWHVPIGSTTNEDVFISGVVVLPYYSRFKVERKEVENNIQDYNLVISSVRREDAGKYTCIDRVGHGEQWHAQLVVLEHRPQCNTNIDQEGFVGDNDCGIPPGEIRCSCSLQYSGNNPPAMEWTNSAGRLVEPQPPMNTSQTNIISSDLLVMKPSLAMSGTSIVWRPKFLTYTNWTSPQVKVKYAMKNEREVNVTHGESVVCSANSSETCAYKWTTQNETIVSEAANLTMIVNTGVYICDATCSLHHDKCTVRSMVAAFKKTHEDDTTKATKETALVVPVVIGMILVSLSVILIVIFCYLHKKRKENNCIPCGEEFQLLNQLETENRMVVGVTILDKLMYVAHQGLNVISVYKIAPSFELKCQNEVDGLIEPCDMAACPLNRCFYITDSNNKCVWKLQVSDGEVTKWVENIDEPYTISVCSSGNVLLVRQPNTVVEYNAEGSYVKKCRVDKNGPRIKDIQHAVENKQRNFIVSHGGKRDKVHAICEVSKDGGLVRSFGNAPGNGRRQLNNPRHVAVDDQDRVYVVDASNDRVLQLDKMFQDVLKLPCSAPSHPLRLAVYGGRILIGKYGAVDMVSICENTKRPRSKLNGEYSAVPVSESNSEEHSQLSSCSQVLHAGPTTLTS